MTLKTAENSKADAENPVFDWQKLTDTLACAALESKHCRKILKMYLVKHFQIFDNNNRILSISAFLLRIYKHCI